jgi:HTH-like domain
MQGSLSVERMCRVAAASRATFYRWLEPSPPVEEEVEVREAIQAVVLAHRRRYGYRRVTRELRSRGWLVNPQAYGAVDEPRQPVGSPATCTTDRCQHPELHHVWRLDGRSQPDPARSYVIIYVIGD